MSFKLKMKSTFYCRDCETVVWELVADQHRVMKAMKMNFSKRGSAKLMERIVMKNVYCPKCELPLIIVEGLNFGVHGRFNATTVRSAGASK